jgi:hypothetical protein
MDTEKETVLAAASYTGALWLMAAGIAVVVVLVVAFFIGTRRSARRRSINPSQAAQARRDLADPAHRGDGWSTPDDDPEQGHPHR